MADTTGANWILDLHEDELLDIARNPEQSGKNDVIDAEAEIRLWSIGATLRRAGGEETIDHLGEQLLPKAIDGDVLYFLWPDYWERLKDEFKIFICTSDKKYADLRKKLASNADKSQTAIVSAIAVGMAAQFGVVAGLLVPFVALCLVVLARTGKEAFCATLKWNTPLGESLKSKPKG
jgi:hypothetical protein